MKVLPLRRLHDLRHGRPTGAPPRPGCTQQHATRQARSSSSSLTSPCSCARASTTAAVSPSATVTAAQTGKNVDGDSRSPPSSLSSD